MSARQFILPLAAGLIVDLFAGGGGMSEAFQQALGRHVDISANHNDDACSMHAVNHPQTKHYIADVFEVCPRLTTHGVPVWWLHLSPDCTHHSQARGGQPRDERIRGLSWVAIRWAGQVGPDVISLENVKQITQWGPLIAKRDAATGRVVKLDGTVAEPGEHVPRRRQFLVPDIKRAGETWRRFVFILESLGYVVETKVLCAADFGAPTTRERLFMVARRDGNPICWPEPTHFKDPKKGQQRWRAAAECIDWSIPGRSIFDRPKPLAEATLRRVAHGMKRYVLDSGDPFIVPVTHSGGIRVHDINDPLRTITTAQRGEFMVAAPVMVQAGHGHGKPGARRWSYGATDIEQPVGTITASAGGHALAAATLVQVGYGEREGQAPRALDLGLPLGTVVAGGGKHGAVTAFMAQANAGFNTTPGHDIRRPLTTVTNTGSQQQLVTAHLAHLRGNCDARDLREPLRTVSAEGQHHGLLEYTLSKEHEDGALRCAAFLIRYYGDGGQWSDLRDPMATITTKDRLALVTVWLKGEPWVVVDICLRMLTPRELYNANSFPAGYVIDRGHDGRVFTKEKQVRMCGNSVPPLLGAALIRANDTEGLALKAAA